MVSIFGGYESDLSFSIKEAKAIKAKMPCPKPRRKVLFTADYDNDGVNAYITRYCCREHAERVAKAFEKAQLFNRIEIEDVKDSATEAINSR